MTANMVRASRWPIKARNDAVDKLRIEAMRLAIDVGSNRVIAEKIATLDNVCRAAE